MSAICAGRNAVHRRSITVIALSVTFFIMANTAILAQKIGPFGLAVKDGSTTLRLHFAAQLKMQYDDLDNNRFHSGKPGLYTEIRRLRLGFSGRVIFPELSYRLQLSFAPESLELMDLYFNYRFNYCFQLQYGQFKAPFTRYRMQSFQQLAFVD